jgi:hypothetical protein
VQSHVRIVANKFKMEAWGTAKNPPNTSGVHDMADAKEETRKETGKPEKQVVMACNA